MSIRLACTLAPSICLVTQDIDVVRAVRGCVCVALFY